MLGLRVFVRQMRVTQPGHEWRTPWQQVNAHQGVWYCPVCKRYARLGLWGQQAPVCSECFNQGPTRN